MTRPVGDRGVALSQLCCPTCGEPIDLRLGVRWREVPMDEFATKLIMARPPYLTCVGGHQWTVRKLYRQHENEDEVLLGEYIGG